MSSGYQAESALFKKKKRKKRLMKKSQPKADSILPEQSICCLLVIISGCVWREGSSNEPQPCSHAGSIKRGGSEGLHPPGHSSALLVPLESPQQGCAPVSLWLWLNKVTEFVVVFFFLGGCLMTACVSSNLAAELHRERKKPAV